MPLIRSINLLRLLLHGLAGLAVAGIVHIVTIFEAPARSQHDAFARLAAITPLNRLARLDAVEGGDQAVPFQDPAMLTAVCRFDLSMGPVRLTLEPLDRDFVTLGMHSRRGVTFYGLTIRSSERNKITLVLLMAEQKATTEADDSGDEPVRDLRIISPDRQGFVLVQTPIGDGAVAVSAQQNLDRVRCESDLGQASSTKP